MIIYAIALGLTGFQGPFTLPAFPSEWKQLRPEAELREGQPVALLAGAATDKRFSAAAVTIVDPPIDKNLHVTLYLRRTHGSDKAQVNAFAYGPNRELMQNTSKEVDFQGDGWARVESDAVAPLGSKSLVLWVVNLSHDSLEVSSPTAEIGATRITTLGGSGILRACAQTVVTGKGGEIRFPVPSPYRNQAPITFSLSSSPPESLKSWKLVKRTSEDWICVAKVQQGQDKPVNLRWESLVLIRKETDQALPKAKFETPPSEVSQWTKPSAVVQSDDPGVVAKSVELRTGCEDVEQFARKVVDFTCRNQGTGQPFVSLDAKAALGCGGSCTSRANLAAALLRAGGVAARTVPHLPTWAYGQRLYEHWLTEYWHPGVGWVWLEPTLGEFEPDPSTIAALAVSTLDDERATGTTGQLGWIMPGAAWMSGIQGFGDLTSGASADEADRNWCRPERRLNVSEKLFAAAKAVWPNVTGSSYVGAMDKAALTGAESDIEAILTQRSRR